MTLRVCPTPDCGALTRSGPCPECRAEKRKQRGTTTQQGLGWTHQQRRATLLRSAIGTHCPDCGELMVDPTRMVADHTTPRSHDPNSVADRVHCRRCSDQQGGKLSANSKNGL